MPRQLDNSTAAGASPASGRIAAGRRRAACPAPDAPTARALLEVSGLTVRLRDPAGSHHEWPVVRDVAFAVRRGECFALVGESGCGKSLTALALTKLPPTDAGRTTGVVTLDGHSLLEVPPATLRQIRRHTAAYVFQDPAVALNPVLRIGAQLAETMPRSRSRAARRADACRLLESVQLPDPPRVLRAFPHELSGGMLQRVVLAMALSGGPRLLIADEPTTALDVTTQHAILSLLDRLRRERGLTVLLITHNLGLVARHADSLAVMYAGEIVESGPVGEVLRQPAHPYTEGLLQAVPRIDHDTVEGLRGIPGRVPQPADWPAGCGFAPRCPHARPCCRSAHPALRPWGVYGRVRCLLPLRPASGASMAPRTHRGMRSP